MRCFLKIMSGVLLGTVVTGVFAFGLSASFAQAAPAYTINYQGKLTDDTGLTVADGTYQMQFNLYTQASGGVTLWTENRSGVDEVTVTNGLFSVMLGEVTSLASVNFNQTLYLGVTIEADGEMTPRKILGTVPSAFEARQLGGVASSSFLRSDAADTASGLLTFSGGFLSTASSTLSALNFLNATGTSLYIGGDRITDFVGTGLALSGSTLTASLGTTIAAAEIADGDHGFFSYASGVASLDTGGLTSTNLRGALTDETGVGVAVFNQSPTFSDAISITGGSSALTLSGSSGSASISLDGDLGSSISLGASGVLLAEDADGAISFLGQGNGSDEELTMNLDDTPNTVTFTSGTGLNTANFSSISLQESGSAVLSVLDVDTSSELAAILGDETGTGNAVFSASPTFTGTVTAADVTLSSTLTITSTNASAFAVGANGATNPVLVVDASTASQIGGIAIKGNGTGAATTITATDSGSNALLTIQTKGNGELVLNGNAGNTSSTAGVTLQSAGTTRFRVSTFAATFSPTANGSAATARFSFTGASDTSLTASTEAPSVLFNLSQTRAHSVGALALQRDFRVAGSNHSFNSGSNTLTDHVIFAVTPSTGTSANATISNTYGIYVEGVALGGTKTNSYGLRVDGSTGASNNYAAVFTGGNVGIGTTTPAATLSVAGDLRLTGMLRDTSNDAGTSGQVLLSTGTGTNWVATSSLGISGTLSNDAVIPDYVLSTGQTDEFCLTYEATGDTWEWQTCGAGGGLTSGDIDTSSELAAILGDETGTGALVFGTSPTFTTSANFGTAGVRLSDDGDGALTLLGLGDGSDEDLTLNLDDTANTGVFTSSTGLNRVTFTNIGINTTAASGYSLHGETYFYASTTNDSISIGQDAGTTFDSTSLFNVAVGYQAALSADASTESNFLGRAAGYNAAGDSNNFIGRNAGFSNNGSYNNSFGYYAGHSNAGAYNNFFGYEAGYSNTGSSTTLIGYRTGRYLSASNTIAIGGEALFGSHATSFISANTIALGYRAGYASNDGAGNNILIGHQVADNLTTGNNNIIIGYNIDSPSATADNILNIGNLLFGTGIDGTGTTLSSGNIGVGTSSPVAKLAVTNSGSGLSFLVEDQASADASPFVVDTSGNVGIGDLTPNAKLDLDVTQTSGTLINVSAPSAVNVNGALTGLNLDMRTNYTANNQTLLGAAIRFPNTSNIDISTISQTGLSIGTSGATISHTVGSGGDSSFTGIEILNPNVSYTAPAAAATAYGVYVVTGTASGANSSQSGLTIAAQGVGAGSLRGVDIGNITAGAGTERAINIGTGWDNAIYSSATAASYFAGALSVGDTVPDSLLDVHAASTEAALAITSLGTNTDALLKFELTDGTATFSMGVDDSDSDKFKISTTALGTNDRLVIDSSGNVGISDASPDAILDIDAPSVTSGTLFGTGLGLGVGVTLTGALVGSDFNLETIYSGSSNQSMTGYKTALMSSTNTAAGTYLYRGIHISQGTLAQNTAAGTNVFTGAFITNPNITQTSGTVSANGVSVTTGLITTGGTQQAFNVIASGVGAGTLYGVNIGNITAGAGTERAINIGTGWDNAIYSAATSSSYLAGALGLGDSTPDSLLDVETDSATNYAAQLFNDGNNTNRYGLLVQAGLDDHTAAGPSTLIQFNDGDGGSVGSITFGSSATAFNTTSDRRLKTNIVDTALGMEELMAIQVRDYNWIADADKSTLTHGFIAQELYEIFPQAVTVPKESDKFWMVDYSKLTPLIIAGVQEQQQTLLSHGDSLLDVSGALDALSFDLSDLEASLSKGISDGFTATESIPAGTIVTLTDEAREVVPATAGDALLGVVSEQEGIILGSSDEMVAVAQVGKVLVRVNQEGGAINIGDPITLSSETGVGAKATTTSRIIGVALEDQSEEGYVQITVRNELYLAESVTRGLGELVAPIAGNEDDTLWGRLTSLANNFVDGLLTVVGIKADRVETQELCVEDVCIDKDDLQELLEGANLDNTPPPEDTPEPPPDTPPPTVPEGEGEDDPLPEDTPEPPPENEAI